MPKAMDLKLTKVVNQTLLLGMPVNTMRIGTSQMDCEPRGKWTPIYREMMTSPW
jgi:hypothetical protein